MQIGEQELNLGYAARIVSSTGENLRDERDAARPPQGKKQCRDQKTSDKIKLLFPNRHEEKKIKG